MQPSVHSEIYAELQAEIIQLDRRIERLKLIADFHREKAGNAEIGRLADHLETVADVLESNVNRLNTRFANLKQIKAAEAALADAGGPLSTAALVEKMISGGFPEKDPARLRNAIFTGMTRKPDKFKKAGRGMWDLVSRNGQTPLE